MELVQKRGSINLLDKQKPQWALGVLVGREKLPGRRGLCKGRGPLRARCLSITSSLPPAPPHLEKPTSLGLTCEIG
jgi:hypothetical protein